MSLFTSLCDFQTFIWLEISSHWTSNLSRLAIYRLWHLTGAYTRRAYLVIPALNNLTFWDKVALRYSLDVVLAESTGSGLLSSTLAVSPAPVRVAEADTTPALRRALYRLVMLPMGAAEWPGADGDIEEASWDDGNREVIFTCSVFGCWRYDGRSAGTGKPGGGPWLEYDGGGYGRG